MILCDKEIRTLAEAGMIDPFEPAQVREGMISYGLSSFGYDLKLAGELRIFTRKYHISDGEIESATTFIDPKAFDSDIVQPSKLYITPTDSYFIIEAFGSALGRSVETLHLPDDVFALCVGKSTYARCGLIVNTTPLEPGWRGKLVIELHNTTPLPIKVYASEGIAQLIFFRGNRPEVTYADRKGKYQGQSGITTARI